MKKIFFVIPNLEYGGAETVVRTLCLALTQSKEYDIWLIYFHPYKYQDKLNLQGIKTICLNKSNRFDSLRLIFSLRSLITRYKPDYVISFLNYTNILALICKILLILPKTKFIVCIRDNIKVNLLKHYGRCSLTVYCANYLRKILYPLADLVTTNSQGSKKAAIKLLNLDPQKVINIYNPINIARVVEKSLADVSHPFFNDPRTRIIIAIGRLTKAKRFDVLLQAVAILIKDCPTVRLIIAGQGELLESLKTLSRGLHIDNYVSFMGFVPEPYAWLRKAEVLVLSSESEGFPNVILEAMALGVPVVSSDCEFGPNEIIRNGQNGLLVPPLDPAQLSSAVKKVLEDKALVDSIKLASEATIKKFDLDKIIPEFIRLFK